MAAIEKMRLEVISSLVANLYFKKERRKTNWAFHHIKKEEKHKYDQQLCDTH